MLINNKTADDLTARIPPSGTLNLPRYYCKYQG